MKKLKGFIALFGAGIIFGSFGIWIRLLSKELTTYQQIAVRNIIGFIFASIIIYLVKQRWSFKNANKWHLLAYTFLFPIAVIFFVFAMLNTKIATATFAFYASSLLFSFFIGKVFFNDAITFVKIIGLVLSVIGLGILFYPFSLSTINLGFVYGIISGLFDTGTNAFRRLLGGKVDRLVLVATQMFGGLVIALILIGVTRQTLPTSISATTILVALIFGFLLMSISFLTLVGFQNFDLNLGTIVISSELIFAPIFAAIAFREFPSSKEIVGGLIIALSIIITQYKSVK